jgi:hypothetical protein
MTQSIDKQRAMLRALWNTSPKIFVALLAVAHTEIHRRRVSDHVYETLMYFLHVKFLKGEQVKVFETVFTFRTVKDGPRVRAFREPEGRPFRAPDDTIMIVDGKGARGDTMEPAGIWNFNTVKDCKGYDKWLADLQRGPEHVEKGHQVNSPFPTQAALDKMNREADDRLSPSLRSGEYGRGGPGSGGTGPDLSGRPVKPAARAYRASFGTGTAMISPRLLEPPVPQFGNSTGTTLQRSIRCYIALNGKSLVRCTLCEQILMTKMFKKFSLAGSSKSPCRIFGPTILQFWRMTFATGPVYFAIAKKMRKGRPSTLKFFILQDLLRQLKSFCNGRPNATTPM